MLTEYPTCSRIGTERSNPQSEARLDEPVSRNACELDSASLRKVGVAMPPITLKPVIIGEEIFECNRWAPRGDWRWRMGKEKSRNLRDPDTSYFGIRKSDVLIVVKKQGNSCGAKGDDCRYAKVEI